MIVEVAGLGKGRVCLGVLALAVGRGAGGLFLPDVVGRDVKEDGQTQKIGGGREVAYSACHRLGHSQNQTGEEKKPAEPQKNQ